MSDFARRLPKSIAQYTTKGVYDASKKTHLSFTQGADMGGASAPGERVCPGARGEPRPIPEREAIGQLDVVGLCAHQSALKGGAIVRLPAFTL